MFKQTTARILAALVFASSLATAGMPVAHAREGNSIGGGIKCYWALVTSSTGVSTYQQICYKSV